MKDKEYYLNKIKEKCDAINAEYNGAFYAMTKQDAIEACTLALFEGLDVMNEETPNPNPHPIQIKGFVRKIQDILEETHEPYMFVPIHAFKVWYDRKRGIIRDYWSY